MAGPVAGFIRTPDDASNTGKKVRTQSRVIGSDTVHEHYVVPTMSREVLGVYRWALDQQTVQASAQNGTSTGFFWAHVPSAVSNKWARIRRLYVTSQHSTALATPTAPRLRFVRFTFTGTASGASVAADKANTSHPSPILDVRTASTGLTVTLVNAAAATALAGALTAVGAYTPADVDLVSPNDEDAFPVMKPGEGYVLYQDVAGTAADTRKFNPVMLTDEVDVA